MKIWGMFIGILLLSGCGGTRDYMVQPPIATTTAANRVTGKYAVLLIPRTTPMHADFGGFSCSGWHFNFDTAQAFGMGAKTFLILNVGNVQYVDTAMSPADLSRKGFAGQIILTEGPVSAESHTGGYATQATAHASVDLTVLRPNGVSFEQNGIAGEGAPDSSLGFCEGMGDAMSLAVTAAMKDALQKSMLILSDKLHASR